MARAQEIATRIASLKELVDVVGAIRALAAVRMRQADHALSAISRYSAVIADALNETAAMLPPRRTNPPAEAAGAARFGLIVIGAEHGFCGAFNRHLVAQARRVLDDNADGAELVIIGTRLGQSAAEIGMRTESNLTMATHTAGVTAVAREAAAAVYRLMRTRCVVRVDALHAATGAGQQLEIRHLNLLPLDSKRFTPTPSPMPPVLNLPVRELFEALATEYLFAMLERAAMESFQAENAARFRAMAAARENIENKSASLTRLAQQVRQESVTTELLDLIAGIEAID